MTPLTQYHGTGCSMLQREFLIGGETYVSLGRNSRLLPF